MKTRTFTKCMAGWLSISALALGLVATTQEAAAALTGNIANTKHNLSSVRSGTSWGTTAFSSGVGTNYTSAGSDQICVFCHTPHGANTPVAAPIWNRSVQPTTAYSMYTMVGTNSTGTPDANRLGMALACLSCHDGTQAMDAMLNAPGSGGFAAIGSFTRASINNAGTASYTWAGTPVNGVMASGTAALLGTDLTNDHPIGMLYCGGGATDGVATTCSDKDFMPATSGGRNKSIVPVNANAVASESVDLKLYGDTLSNSVVLCGTCHDPHLDVSGTNKTFLRIKSAGSAICLTCHTK